MVTESFQASHRIKKRTEVQNEANKLLRISERFTMPAGKKAMVASGITLFSLRRSAGEVESGEVAVFAAKTRNVTNKAVN